MQREDGLLRYAGLTALAAAVTILVSSVGGAFGSGAAAYTTFSGADATAAGCLDNPTGVNCNNYADKSDVYVNGGPVNGSGLPDGSYYFSVVVPGYQHDGFIDGHKGNLSDTTIGGTTGDGGSGDSYLCREVTVSGSGATFSYTPDGGCTTPHAQGTDPQHSTVTQLMPYDDTSNAGSVYILAICPVSVVSAVKPNPSDCKFDAFRINAATVPSVDDLIVSKTATPTFARDYDWSVNKTQTTSSTPIDSSASSVIVNYQVTATWSGPTDSGWQVTGDITITNPNGVAATGVGVTDTLSTGGSLADGGIADGNATCIVNGGTNTNLSVDPNSAINLPYTCSWAANTAPVTSNGAYVAYTNNVHVTWDNSGAFNSPDPSADATASVTFGDGSTGNPTVTHDKTTVTDTFNSGTPGVIGVVGVDESFAPDTSPDALAANESYDAQSQTFTFTYSRSVTVVAGTCTTYRNVATVSDDATSNDNSSSASVRVCGGADLQVVKTATPALKRTYNWTISKSVDKTRVEQIGGTATFNYTVNASETGFTDSGWVVTGTITVSNPNDWESVTLTGVSDSIDNGGNCSITSGNKTATLAPKGQTGDSATLGYKCTFASNPGGGTNTAAATWDSSAASTPDGSASGTAGYDFSNATITRVNQTITVTDCFALSTVTCTSPTTLGTLTATDVTPFAAATYTYSHTVNVPANNCLRYTNTAVIVETKQSDTKTVEVCGPAKTGALTMGFWQNKNGQGIITGGASTGGVCNSGTWLRLYAPFQDLSATASCSAVATYVYNIIKAANASGASMNAMLKAQMLATALDVYFSDPALGGNKIGAPAPIGGVKIDLTKICHMIDSSNGTATCSGTFENVSSAFGGATSLSLTVSQMLTYAASQSNAGGSFWYGNNKTTQGLAKDAFDAINNQVAFSA
jgi:hypothetical protein